MSKERQRALARRDKTLDTIQVMIVPITIAASIILRQTPVPELVLTASYTLVGGNLALLVFRKVAGYLPSPKK